MVPETLAFVFTIIGGFAGGVYLIEVGWRVWRRVSGVEAEARHQDRLAVGRATVELMDPRIRAIEETLEGLAQGLQTEMGGLHRRLDGLAQALEEMKRQE